MLARLGAADPSASSSRSRPKAAPTAMAAPTATTIRPPRRPPRLHHGRRPARCKILAPGSRRPIRSAPSATRTGSNGRSRPATSPIAPRSSLDRRPARARRRPQRRHPARLRLRAPSDPAPLAELAEALAPSAERQLETIAQGAAFARVTAAAWGLAAAGRCAYPVALGHAARAARTAARRRPRRSTSRPSPPTSSRPGSGCPARPDRRPAGHRRPDAALRGGGRRGRGSLARRPSAAPPSAPTSRSMRHETQYTRLFRS